MQLCGCAVCAVLLLPDSLKISAHEIRLPYLSIARCRHCACLQTAAVAGGDDDSSAGPGPGSSAAALRTQLDTQQQRSSIGGGGGKRAKLPGLASLQAAAAARAALQQQQSRRGRGDEWSDADEDEYDEAEGPEFEVVFDKGTTVRHSCTFWGWREGVAAALLCTPGAVLVH